VVEYHDGCHALPFGLPPMGPMQAGRSKYIDSVSRRVGWRNNAVSCDHKTWGSNSGGVLRLIR
jgi:hypothetical protein